MSFWQNINPTGAIADFITVYKEAGSNRWYIAIAAAALTFGSFSTMAWESWKKPRALPTITYIRSWPSDRTEAETRAFVEENQRRKEEQAKLLAEQEKIGQDLWMAVGRASGVNVDKIKRQADAEKAAAAAKAKADAEKLLERVEPAAAPQGAVAK